MIPPFVGQDGRSRFDFDLCWLVIRPGGATESLPHPRIEPERRRIREPQFLEIRMRRVHAPG
jgi:hypothetical protein